MVSGELQNGSLAEQNNETFSNQHTHAGNFSIKCHENGELMERELERTEDRNNGEWRNDCALDQVCRLQRRVEELEEEVSERERRRGKKLGRE